MKLVREHIEFTREGKNPIKSLYIGKRVEIDNWFKTWAPNTNYEIDNDLNIRTKGSLNLRRTNIISLPDNLIVNGWLDIIGSKIISLPANLHVGMNLHIRNTNITSLPADLYVGEKIFKDF